MAAALRSEERSHFRTMDASQRIVALWLVSTKPGQGHNSSIKVVSQRLGHGRTEVTMTIYAHALPTAQKEAAAKMASLLR